MDPELNNFDEITEALSRIIFRIRIAEPGGYSFGTGFFIHPEGYALTAFHNLAEEVLRDASRPIKASYRDETINLHWLLPEEKEAQWQKRFDIAVLQGPPGILQASEAMPLAYLDPAVDRPQRAVFWRGRQIVIVGYPLRSAPEPKLILGSMSVTAPITDPMIVNSAGQSKNYAFGSLAFGDDFQRNCEDIRGVSGAPVYDCGLKRIVAVQFAAWPDRQRVYATEFHRLAEHWRDFSGFADRFEMPLPLLSASSRLASETPKRHRPTGVDRVWTSDHFDPFRQEWETACRQEEQGQLQSALIRFNAILTRQPDYPGLRPKIQHLKQLMNQQKRSRELSDQIRGSMKTSDYVRLREVLTEAASLVQDEGLASVLESAAFELRQELSKLIAKEEWILARDTYSVLHGIAVLIPAGRRPQLPPASAFESGVEKALDQAVRQLQDLRTRQQWTELVSSAEHCLHANPGNMRVQALLTEAVEVLWTTTRIEVLSPGEAGDGLQRFKPVNNGAPESESTLSPQMGEISAYNKASEAFHQKAEKNRVAGRLGDAEIVCKEWIALEPDSNLAHECLRKVFLDQAASAVTNGKWEKVRDLCNRVLTIAPGDPVAQKLLAKADDTLTLAGRIRKLS